MKSENGIRGSTNSAAGYHSDHHRASGQALAIDDDLFASFTGVTKSLRVIEDRSADITGDPNRSLGVRSKNCAGENRGKQHGNSAHLPSPKRFIAPDGSAP